MLTLINTRRFTLCFHRCWTPWHWLNEAGLLTVQVGPLLAEIALSSRE